MATTSGSASPHAPDMPEWAGQIKPPAPINPAQLSFAERKARLARASTPHLVEGDQRMLRDIDWPPPGDPRLRPRKTPSGPELSKQRSQYFEDAFSARGSGNIAKERIRNEALVMAEVKTNMIVVDEFTVITELSSHLSLRYKRPLSSVVVVLQHGACMCFGGTFDPAYVMSVFALPSELQPTTNKRNAALIQRYMHESLGVPPSRGLLRFVPTAEENLAHNGRTTAGEIDESAKDPAGESSQDTIASRRPKATKKLSVKSFGTLRDRPRNELTPPASAGDDPPPVPPLPTIPQEPAEKENGTATREKKARRSKSFIATIFVRSAKKLDSPSRRGD